MLVKYSSLYTHKPPSLIVVLALPPHWNMNCEQALRYPCGLKQGGHSLGLAHTNIELDTDSRHRAGTGHSVTRRRSPIPFTHNVRRCILPKTTSDLYRSHSGSHFPFFILALILRNTLLRRLLSPTPKTSSSNTNVRHYKRPHYPCPVVIPRAPLLPFVLAPWRRSSGIENTPERFP